MIDRQSQRVPPEGREDAASRREQAPTERLLELAVLAAVGAGAASGEVAAALSEGGSSLDRVDVQRRVERLERQGLLRRAEGDGPAWALTAAGRRATLVLAGECVAAAAGRDARAAELAAERAQLERLRTDLLSTISHELRTPLTLIRTSIGLLVDSNPDEAMRQRLLRNVKQSTDRMHALVTDLLDLARLRGDRLELQVRRVDLGDLVGGAVALMRPLFDAKAQRLAVTIPAPAPVVPGDQRRLERVLLNLLSNATKFAPQGAEVGVRVTDGAEEATIAVRDTGPGISEEGLPHLFEQFFTERTSSSRHSIGAGLGLPIAKGIVEAHGGRMWAESAVGVGTTVSFALPKAWPHDEDEAAGGDG